ncbi:hypothetical protein AK830_g6519 [Neonectria ditissima]|uniref:F-box domain-containing protein n=1 Tax=Neonectria ditissima TaxID=78410 RepID=A0A0P7BHZ9_9HYPO|nr:hypothetical protein AK830_g6519 [Neonectria ditissima]
MSSCNSPIALLPNETLSAILSHSPTLELLPFALVNRRFYSLVAQVLHQRLIQATPVPENQLMLECYHPSVKFYTPYLACKFQKTVVRDGPEFDVGSPTLSDLQRLYASYRIVWAEENRRPRRIRARFANAGPSQEAEDDITVHVDLDEGESFSQLCAGTYMVKEGPKPGIFVSHISIDEGVIRVFRKWLAERASQTPPANESHNILWIDRFNNVGIRFRVNPAASERMPLISGPEDEPPVSYSLVYEELLVRASTLLRSTEEMLVQEISDTGNTVVIHGAALSG